MRRAYVENQGQFYELHCHHDSVAECKTEISGPHVRTVQHGIVPVVLLSGRFGPLWKLWKLDLAEPLDLTTGQRETLAGGDAEFPLHQSCRGNSLVSSHRMNESCSAVG